MNVNSAEAKYGKEASLLELSIIDGAGETGSAIVYMIRLRLATDFEEREGDNYEQSVKLKGYRAIEAFRKDEYAEEGEIDVLIGNRFLVSLKAKGMSMEALRQILDELPLKQLERLALQ